MKPLNLTYDSICTACGATLKRQDLAFSELDLLPYHRNMTDCNKKHPNSYDNYNNRNGNAINMLSVAEAQKEYRKRRVQSLDIDNKDKVMSLLYSPTTVRLDTVENAAHIVHVAEENNITIAEAYRRIISEHREKLSNSPLRDTGEVASVAVEYKEPEVEPETTTPAEDDDLNDF